MVAPAGGKVAPHFSPAYCPHLNPIERLWFVMHDNINHRLYFPKFRDCADAIPTFPWDTVPRNFKRFSSAVTDNFRVTDPKNFQILA